MRTVRIARVLSLVVFSIKLSVALGIKPETLERNGRNCEEQSKQPYFDIEQIIGKPWRIYYTWNMGMEDKCLDLTFKNATKLHASRLFNDMSEYLEAQPVWDAATLFVTLGVAKHQLLLFPDQGAAGRLIGVPNIVRDGNITPSRNSVPFLKFFLKLVHDGKYLLMMDCSFGVASLMSREHPPYRAEIGSVVTSLNLVDAYGSHACVADKRKDDFLLQ